MVKFLCFVTIVNKASLSTKLFLIMYIFIFLKKLHCITQYAFGLLICYIFKILYEPSTFHDIHSSSRDYKMENCRNKEF